MEGGREEIEGWREGGEGWEGGRVSKLTLHGISRKIK